MYHDTQPTNLARPENLSSLHYRNRLPARSTPTLAPSTTVAVMSSTMLPTSSTKSMYAMKRD